MTQNVTLVGTILSYIVLPICYDKICDRRYSPTNWRQQAHLSNLHHALQDKLVTTQVMR